MCLRHSDVLSLLIWKPFLNLNVWKNISWQKNSKKMCELGNYSSPQKVNHHFQTIYILEECFEGWNHTPDFFHFLLKKGGRL